MATAERAQTQTQGVATQLSKETDQLVNASGGGNANAANERNETAAMWAALGSFL